MAADVGEGIILLVGALPESQVDPVTRTHYYPNVNATLSAQTFVPLGLVPNAVLVRCRRGLAAAPFGALQCRVFDATGNSVPVVNPIVSSLQNLANWGNQKFQIDPSAANFPAYGLWTFELDLTNVDLAGLVRCYGTTFPFIVSDAGQEVSCTTTVVIS